MYAELKLGIEGESKINHLNEVITIFWVFTVSFKTQVYLVNNPIWVFIYESIQGIFHSVHR